MSILDKPAGLTPKMRVRIVENANTPDGKAILLCDERGDPLPNQISARVHHPSEGLATISVVFAIDGKEVALG